MGPNAVTLGDGRKDLGANKKKEGGLDVKNDSALCLPGKGGVHLQPGLVR